MKNAFYCNKPCIILADLGNEAVIEIQISEYFDDDYCEPITSSIIVDKKYLSEKQVDVQKEFEKTLRDIEAAKRNSEAELRNKKVEAEAEIKSIKERTKKYKGLEQWLLYLEGKLQWFVMYEYNSAKVKNICHISELNYGERPSKPQGFIFRETVDYYNRGRSEVEMFINRYSDWSGSSSDACRGFETIDEALKIFIASLDKTEIDRNTLSIAEKHKVTHSKIEAYKKEQEEIKEKSRLEKIEKLKKELEELNKPKTDE